MLSLKMQVLVFAKGGCDLKIGNAQHYQYTNIDFLSLTDKTILLFHLPKCI